MSRSFNGTSDTALASLVSSAVDNVSWGGWFWAASTSQANALPFFNGNEGSNGYGINFNGGNFQLFLGGINFFTLFAPSALQWYHTLFVRRSGQWVGYLNGSPTNLAVTAPNVPTIGTVFGSGEGQTSRFFAGNLAEWAFWNAALSDQEAAGLALGRRPSRVRPASLLAYWPLFGFGTAEPDLSNNGFNLTLTGTAFANHAPVTTFTRTEVVNVEVILPVAPTGLTATAVSGGIGLSWSSTTPPPVTFSIYRSTTPGGETLYDNGIAPTSYTDGGVMPGITYYYKVSATDPGGEGPLSNEASATAPVPAPTGLTATGKTKITLTWNPAPAGSGISLYKVYRNGGLLATVSSSPFTDVIPVPNSLVTYTVSAVVINGQTTTESAQSSPVTVQGPESPASAGPLDYLMGSLFSQFPYSESLVRAQPGPVPPVPPFPFPANPPTVIAGAGANKVYIQGNTAPD